MLRAAELSVENKVRGQGQGTGTEGAAGHRNSLGLENARLIGLCTILQARLVAELKNLVDEKESVAQKVTKFYEARGGSK